MNVTVSAMTLEDVDDVAEIERLSFSSPWSRASLVDELTRNTNATYLVMRDDQGKAHAYGGMWIILDEAHITNIAVHPRCRRMGIGCRLMQALMVLARARGAKRMTLEVRTTNAGAQLLYRQLGFVPRGIRRGYYLDSGDDALVMWIDDLDHAIEEQLAGEAAAEGGSTADDE